jgi:hypothetical protein
MEVLNSLLKRLDIATMKFVLDHIELSLIEVGLDIVELNGDCMFGSSSNHNNIDSIGILLFRQRKSDHHRGKSLGFLFG